MNSERRQASAASSPSVRHYDLEERLLEFATAIIDISEKLPKSRAGNHVAGQLLRAGTSPYGNHGEAQEPESPDDFIHKLKVCLKELREARRWARLIERKRWLRDDPQLTFLLREAEELIRIFKASVQTAERNRASRRPGRSDSHASPGRPPG
ncbi:MAG: four helix bundle protein [Verrucomicrobiae bacterium]|nr:four helix bundle protein [Verrucomicrobiae bacterium]MDW8309146.1 four helix bundle protein [Verrucomicrobiales bacterium]